MQLLEQTPLNKYTRFDLFDRAAAPQSGPALQVNQRELLDDPAFAHDE